MNQSWDEQYKNMWDDRYKGENYVYGKEPNSFFKEWLQKFESQSILIPADGEGRNGVFAAQQGWNVTACDLSVQGRSKALQLAEANHVTMNYVVGDLEHLQFENESFDAIALIYAHFAADKKSLINKKLNTYLKPGGIVIFEAFSKKHLHLKSLDPNIGGPADIDMLFSKKELITDFEDHDILLLEEKEIILDAGQQHRGTGSVIRFVSRKPY